MRWFQCLQFSTYTNKQINKQTNNSGKWDILLITRKGEYWSSLWGWGIYRSLLRGQGAHTCTHTSTGWLGHLCCHGYCRLTNLIGPYPWVRWLSEGRIRRQTRQLTWVHRAGVRWRAQPPCPLDWLRWQWGVSNERRQAFDIRVIWIMGVAWLW